MSPEQRDSSSAGGRGRTSGSQTLARGLSALQLVAEAPTGLGVQEVAERLGVHRTIAYRMLTTLTEFRLVARGADGLYRPGSGTVALADAYTGGVREAALPLLRRIADELGATVALLAAEGGEAVAVAVAEPQSVSHHLSFRVGSRHPLTSGSGGLALRSMREPASGDEEEVRRARKQGYARTYGQVEPGAYGVAVPVELPGRAALVCVNLITLRKQIAEQAVDTMRTLAADVAAAAG